LKDGMRIIYGVQAWSYRMEPPSQLFPFAQGGKPGLISLAEDDGFAVSAIPCSSALRAIVREKRVATSDANSFLPPFDGLLAHGLIVTIEISRTSAKTRKVVEMRRKGVAMTPFGWGIVLDRLFDADGAEPFTARIGAENDELYAVFRPLVLSDQCLIRLRDGRDASEKKLPLKVRVIETKMERIAVKLFSGPPERRVSFNNGVGDFSALALDFFL